MGTDEGGSITLVLVGRMYYYFVTVVVGLRQCNDSALCLSKATVVIGHYLLYYY